MQVAALEADDKVMLKPIAVGRNPGNRVEIESGLSASDRLAGNNLLQNIRNQLKLGVMNNPAPWHGQDCGRPGWR